MSGREPLTSSAAVSGFPEWLPEHRLIEAQWTDVIRARFESYGYTPIETPAVERLESLLKKGETSQEVYVLQRLQAEADEQGPATMGLHFDLTVPFARYVARHLADLQFPFKRYQIQKVWRGERPQEGRFREFTQCDIDVINRDTVPLHFDAEMPRVVHEILTELSVGPFVIEFNNRKVLEGFYQGLDIADPIAVIRIMDKIGKIGAVAVEQRLREQAGLDARQAAACLSLAEISSSDEGVVGAVRALGVRGDLLDEGLDELGTVIGSLGDLPTGSVLANLSIARGLDYYTGSVYEGRFLDYPDYGSICSGGRYENLAGTFVRQSLPGVGISIGLTRIFAKMLKEGLLTVGRRSPTDVLVAVTGGDRAGATATAARLRARGINTEVFHAESRIAKQLSYASGKGIPYVWFPKFADDGTDEVKDLGTGDQQRADADHWTP